MNDTEKNFQAGYDAGLAALDYLIDNKVEPGRDSYAGLLSAIFTSLYYAAPNQEAVDSIMEFAKESALEKEGEVL